MVNPIEQNSSSNTVQSGSTNNPDESLKNALYIQEPTLPEVNREIETEDESVLKAMIDKGPAYEYINNLGNNGKLGQIIVDANGQVTYDGDVTHAVTGKSIALYVLEGDLPPPPPPAVIPNAVSRGQGDPHFTGFNGHRFDYHGIPGHIFNLLSDAKIQVNSLFSSWKDSGSTIMEQIGVLIGKDKLLVSRSGHPNLNGNSLGSGQSVELKNGAVTVSGNTVSISTKEYLINIFDRGVCLDIDIKTTSEGINRDEVMPGGIIGQTASGNGSLSVGAFIVHDGIFGTNVASNRYGAKTKTDKLKDKIKEKYNFI